MHVGREINITSFDYHAAWRPKMATPAIQPFETHIGRLITETEGLQVKLGADKGTLKM